MRKWKIIREMQFYSHRDENQRDKFIYTYLYVGEIFEEVPQSQWSHNLSQSVKSSMKRESHTQKLIVLEAKGKRRIIRVGKDAVPVLNSIKRNARVKRNEN